MQSRPHLAARVVGRTTATKVMTPTALVTALLFREWPGAGRMAIATAGVLGVASARLREREHHRSDVAAGAVIGLAALAAAHAVTRTSWWRAAASRS